MLNIKQLRKNKSSGDTVNMAPLIDMVFILLIFFIVTSHFSKESAVTINAPSAKTSKQLKKETLVFSIIQSGALYYENRIINVESVKAIVISKLRETPTTAVLVRADKNSKTDTLIKVIDKCKSAGADNIQIAANNENE